MSRSGGAAGRRRLGHAPGPLLPHSSRAPAATLVIAWAAPWRCAPRKLRYTSAVMAEERLTERQAAILEIEALGLPRRDAMRLVTQRVGYFVGQARYAQELAKARKLLTSLPPDVAGGGEDALVR